MYPILPHCLNFEELSIDCKSTFLDGDLGGTVRRAVALPRLHTVQLEGVLAVDGLQYLKAPVVRDVSLTIGDVGGQKWAVDGCALVLLARGGTPISDTKEPASTLKHLTLDGAIFDEADASLDEGRACPSPTRPSVAQAPMPGRSGLH